MAKDDGRGGYREPSGGPRASGVGRNSQRSDAAQPIRTARVSDAEDLTHGDRQKLEAAQRIAPLGRPQTAPIEQGRPRGGNAARAGGGGGGMPMQIPEYIFSKPSTRPDEPETEGLEMGPGAGPEVLGAISEPETEQEIALQFLVDTFQDEAAYNMLNEIRSARVQPEPELPTPDISPVALTESVPSEEGGSDRTLLPLGAPTDDMSDEDSLSFGDEGEEDLAPTAAEAGGEAPTGDEEGGEVAAEAGEEV